MTAIRDRGAAGAPKPPFGLDAPRALPFRFQELLAALRAEWDSRQRLQVVARATKQLGVTAGPRQRSRAHTVVRSPAGQATRPPAHPARRRAGAIRVDALSDAPSA